MKHIGSVCATRILPLLLLLALPAVVKSQTNTDTTPVKYDERVVVKIIKVYSAQDGDAKFRAYVVEWRDQELIWVDPTASANLKVGDIISGYIHHKQAPSHGQQVLELHLFPDGRVPFVRSDEDTQNGSVTSTNQPRVPFRRSGGQ